jgi:cell division septum initiation protein DivIVA
MRKPTPRPTRRTRRPRARPADPKGDAASWRKRRQDLDDALDRAKLFAESLQSRINGLTADFSARDDPAQRQIVAADRQRALSELDRVKKEIQLHTKAVADLQEEARKNGVPPGWLR